ncbi:MAG TPA: DUF4386 domain-containing protein [Flavilitoribacter sp.]|nr:DUF4386 domain-containing protein [Flavilitoribacter sp.]HMQ87671.1 DUF4386 domain-containing protein [Flavilitoribacter sp.]
MKSTKEPSAREDRTPVALPEKNARRVNEIVTGYFFITATVSAIIGLKLYDPMLTTVDFLEQGATHSRQIISGAVFEMILVLADCGTAIMLYPYLKAYNERMALGYFCFRVIETVFILLGIVSILSLLTLSHSYAQAGNADSIHYYAAGILAKSFHDWTFILGPKFVLGINTFIYSYVFLKTGLVPRKLSLLGLTGAGLVFMNALSELFGIIPSLSAGDLLLAFPVAIYEMILAGRLISKGFNIQYIAQNI